ncbi:1,4-alpha-glucan branching enzyme/maltooligosyltrehalose trehalohydrolase [Nitrosomonas sp. Nm51]|uniref:malto-oligosyltrehalose trehalohydrolase n=1 Tax=Nitrosomonas sp. Nm51 TaxID=133720 RepID=UPI0008B774C6|nr:malto-oligosyltrehalose trehalohydrolase [Nitrosomonas sp. Nm51]SER17764.1 1,4-alpha-glucan branching enzyme/maltooligosyltrehalose trehalohydrolase [Nitrosomonas sp. Nm51]
MSDNTPYHMPFGAELQDEEGVRFRLWAPAARSVDVCLKHSIAEETVPMTALTDGWFEVTTTSARPGTCYRFRIDGDKRIPDPASRFQPEDVHGPSEVIDSAGWHWQDAHWMGRPWEETVIYELHVGSFTPDGNFAGALEKFDYLMDLGITAVELMPVADFPGKRNWGYDGTYLFAPDSRYGRPDDLKALVDAAHARNMMVFLDVVYNHFGPEGNYLHLYAPQFFTEKHRTPWGAAINFDDEHSHWVRQFFIHNALYWLEEYHVDGLRLDAVHAIMDDSQPDILTELSQRIQTAFSGRRHIHLILENDHNAARYLARDAAHKPRTYTAQWNDDIHHALHVLLTGETGGYYMDYAQNPIFQLGRCLTEGFAYQGESSPYRDGEPRGETSRHLPSTAFVSFLQNHDQVGNRAFGERIQSLASPAQVHAATALLLLAPSPPLLFMGEEWGCRQPFPFFCDFGPDLADAVVNGRREEFARFPEFSNPDALARIPDPMNENTFLQAVLNWTDCGRPAHASWLKLYRELLALRHREIIPRLRDMERRSAGFKQLNAHTLYAYWVLADDTRLSVYANFGDEAFNGCNISANAILYTTQHNNREQNNAGALPSWSVIWCLNEESEP